MKIHDNRKKITKGRLAIAFGLVILTVVLFYIFGLFTELPAEIQYPGGLIEPETTTSGFLVSNLSIQPENVEPNQPVTVELSVTNTHDTWGIYNLVLKINGVNEAEEQTNIDAGTTQNVSFSVKREDPGRYNVFINGLSGSFTVVTPALP